MFCQSLGGVLEASFVPLWSAWTACSDAMQTRCRRDVDGRDPAPAGAALVAKGGELGAEGGPGGELEYGPDQVNSLS